MHNRIQTMLLLVGDSITLVCSFLLMVSLAEGLELYRETFNTHVLPFSILSMLWIVVFFIFNLYDTEKSKPTIPHLGQIINAFIFNTMLSVVFFYLTPFFKVAPKTNLLIFSFISLILFLFWRRVFYIFFSSYFKKSVVFINQEAKVEPYVQDLVSYIKEYPQSGFDFKGEYKSIEEFLKTNKEIPEVFITTNGILEKPENLNKIHENKSTILDLVSVYENILGRIPVDAINENWLMYNILTKQNNNIDLKRITSLVFAILVLLATSPLLLVISLIIKLQDGGPIFYSQQRVGRDGKDFTIYKFRSMIINAEKNGPEWSKTQDPRITTFGKMLRRLHIDEIPQMWNIIKGDLALIGPRPERGEFVKQLEQEIPFYNIRHIISPGFTGWAQIKFRYAGSVMDSKKKFEYDLYYIKNKNILMDIGIIIRTIQIIFTH